MTRRSASAHVAAVGLVVGLLQCWGGAWSARAAEVNAPTAVPASVVYYARRGDTLIGLGERALAPPSRWVDVQRLNAIANPRRIPTGTPIRIPLSWLRWQPLPLAVTALQGSVTRDGRAVAVGDALPAGSAIQSAADGSATLRLTDGTTLTLHPSARLVIDRLLESEGVDARDIELRLEDGRVDIQVVPRRDVGRFEIQTPVAVSAVRGTRFRSTFDDAAAVAHHETLEGVVEVANAAAAVSVQAGFGTRIDAGAAPAAPRPLLPAPDLNGVAVLSEAPTWEIGFPPVTGARAYRIEASRDPDFHVLDRDLRTDEPRMTLTELPDATYSVRARAIDELGLEGNDARREIVRRVLPDPPALLTPVANATLTAAPFDLTWVGDDSLVRLQIARDDAFHEPVLDTTTTRAAESLSEALAPGRYVWRIARVGASGDAGRWSDPRSFSVWSEPPRPDIVRIARARHEVRWTATPGQRLQLEIARDADFNDVAVSETSAQSPRLVRNLMPATYYARTRALAEDGSPGPASPAQRFEIAPPFWARLLHAVILATPLL